MRIAFVSDAIYPYMHGGKEKRLHEISTRLAQMGHDVHIYTMHWWDNPEKTIEEDGMTLHAISKKYEMYSGDRRSISEGILFALACFKLMTAQFDIIDVDHMPFFPIFSIWMVCKLRGKKLYGTWHEALTVDDWTSYMGKAGYAAALIERVCIKLPYKISAASKQTKTLLASCHNRTKRVDLVESGIDTVLMNEVTPQPSACDVLYVGRLVKDKNIDVLIKAFSLVVQSQPSAHCIIVGKGVEHSNLEQLVRTLGLTKHVTMLDPIPDARDVYAYMKSAKVFVLPSSREGFGIAALEALGCDTPVVTVATAANAAKNLITEGETGSIVELDAAKIAEAILFWITAAVPPTSISTRFAEYDWRVLAQRQAEVYAS
jgi:glycosyltransferase involved in cell wall biosynthesis